MRLVRYILNRHPLPVCALIVAGGLTAGGYVHDYIVNVLQPRQLAMAMTRIEGEVADADMKFRLRRYSAAARVYRYVINAHAEKLAPREVGRLYHQMAVAHRLIAERSDPEKNLKLAVEALQGALALRPREADPLAYAESQTELGQAYGAQAQHSDSLESVPSAVAAYGKALEVYTAEAHPYQYGTVNRLMANTHRDAFRSGEEQEDQRMAPAIAAYGKALEVFDAERYPREHGDTLIDMGLAYQRLAEGIFIRANTFKAIDAYKGALEVFTQARHPRDFGRTQRHLGEAYMVLAERGAPPNESSADRMRHRYRNQRLGRRALELAAQFAGDFSLGGNGEK